MSNPSKWWTAHHHNDHILGETVGWWILMKGIVVMIEFMPHILSSLIINMKKHRRVGNATSTNFFTSQFKLTSSEFPKQPRNKKINTTFTTFRHQLFQQQPKALTRYPSKQAKPIIQQLKFSAPKNDDFKLPLSVTKRSLSKAKDQSRLKMETKNNQLYEQHFQEVEVNKEEMEKKPPLYHFAATKRMNQTKTKNTLKQKLERNALQKFNETFLKENEENQNVVSEKNAESLYVLLKTARMNQFKHQNVKLRNQSAQNEEESEHSMQERTQQIDQEQEEGRKGSQKSYEDLEERSNKGKSIKEVAKSKQSLFKTFDQKVNVPSIAKPDIPLSKPRTSIPQKQAPKIDVIHPQKVQCDQSERQKFTQSEQESQSDFGMELNEKSKISVQRQKSSQTSNVPASNKQIPANNAQTQNQISKKTTERSEDGNRKMPQSDEERVSSKNKINPQPKKNQKQKKYEQSDLDNIPNGESYDKTTTTRPIPDDKQPRKGSIQFLSNNQIQKVLTPKHLEQPPSIKTVPKITAPPKLPNPSQAKPNPQKPTSYQAVEADQLEQIDLGGDKNTKKEPEPMKSKKQIPPAPSSKPEQQKKEKPTTLQAKTAQAPSQAPQKTQQKAQQEESSEAGVEDELTYYIQRIQDVGQYRINSKDVYNDKSIDKQLVQIHKICAYYMAHQFLYLAQWTCNYLKGNNFTTNYYSISPQQLMGLKESGVLEAEIENLSENIESSKKLLKKCYDESKIFLKKEEQILLMDGKTNYHIKCCAFLIKQFKKVYDLYLKAPKNAVMLQRCVYLIEIYCVMKLLNGQELKEYQEFQDIQDPKEHIQTYKKLLLSI